MGNKYPLNNNIYYSEFMNCFFFLTAMIIACYIRKQIEN